MLFAAVISTSAAHGHHQPLNQGAAGGMNMPAPSNSHYAALSDNDLVERSRDEERAFSELVRRHRGPCLRAAMSILRDAADAEDAVQNALLNAFVHLRDFQLRASFKNWLIRIVINQSLMILRKNRRVRLVQIEPLSYAESESVELYSTRKTPEEMHFVQELGAALRDSLQRLPAVYGRVLSMQTVDQLAPTAIADGLQITPAAAKSRIYRARRALRRRLEERLNTRYSASAIRLTRTA